MEYPCSVLSGGSVDGICGEEILFGAPHTRELSRLTGKIRGLVIGGNETMAHSVIFLKHMGVSVAVADKCPAGKGDRVRIDAFSNTLSINNSALLDVREARAERGADYAVTADGRTVRLKASVLTAGRAPSIPVGIWRTEGLLLDGYRDYTFDYLKLISSNPEVWIRLFDLEGDKACLIPAGSEKSELFEEQMECLLSLRRPLRLLVPEVKSGSTIRKIKELVSPRGKIQVGAMVENLEAIDNLSDIVRSSDYIWIGCNGLYRSCRDKKAVVRMLARALGSAAYYRVGSGVCGELLYDAEFLKSAVALGAETLCIEENAAEKVIRMISGISFT